MAKLPAIAIGGPPHSGKSVLTYTLTQALRDQGVAHYVLRACPDGEGDWYHQSPPELVRLLRHKVKGSFTDTFIEQVIQALQNRHLPLLVDVGGRPTQEQEVIFDDCTHAILIAPDESSLEVWRNLAERHHLIIIAELHSTLTEPNAVYATWPSLRGRIAGLERHQPVTGEVLNLLLASIKHLFDQPPSELKELHLRLAPVELTVELERMGKALGLAPGKAWQPLHLPAVLNYLPKAESLAVYGRGPNWLYAALAVHAYPADFYQFDVRLGWVTPPSLRVLAKPQNQAIQWAVTQNADAIGLNLQIIDTYLDYSEAVQLELPLLPDDQGLIIDGKLPLWLYTGVVLAYQSKPWIAVYQPHLNQNAIVVASRMPELTVGQLIPMQN